MKIIIDGMGGDNAPGSVVEGATLASKVIDHEIVIIGQEELINEELKKYKYDNKKISVVNATEVIETSDAPVKSVRTKKDSSIVRGLNMVKAGEGDVFISGGSTGALLAGGLFILGRIQGIDRPAIATMYPVMGQEPSLLLDAGANADCKPNNLLEFGIMGSIYMDKVIGRNNPKVGLVNNGSEEGKGNVLTKAVYELLSKTKLNFIGNVEAREIPLGGCDVIVADGFTGNAILKLSEGFGLMVLREMKRRFTAGTKEKMGAMLLKNQLKGMKAEFDYSEYGGAPVLGLRGPLVKMHGSSDAKAVKNTIIKAIPYVEENVVDIIQNSVVDIEEILLDE